MTELLDFLKILYRRKITLIVIPLITVIAAFFLVRNLPDSYIAHTRLATGLVDKSQQMLSGKSDEQESKISQEFDNLIQMIQLKKIVNQVSYKLMLHDLGNDTPFRQPSKLVKQLNPAAIKHAREVFEQKYQKMEELSLWDSDEAGLNRVLQSMKYDNGAIGKKLTVYRQGNGDFIILEFESGNPQLSAFVLNTLTQEFIKYYTSVVKENKYKGVNFLDSLLKQKQAIMESKMLELRNYKIQNHVLNLNEQAKSMYGQIADFETRREMTGRDIIAYTAALNNIDTKFNPSERKYLESAMTNINQDIILTKQQLAAANDAYIRSDFDPKYKPAVDSLKSQLASDINASSDKYVYNPLTAKENLVTQKLSLEVSLELAKNSVQSVSNELTRLQQKLDRLVPNEAMIQGFENDIDVASKEYLEILARFNQQTLDAGTNIQLRQVEKAMPGDLQPGKKMLLVILSGIISFVFCVLVFFILFYFDNSINTSAQLANTTDLPVLGYLNRVKESPDLQNFWNRQLTDTAMQQFRDLLRSIRFELKNDLGTDKVIGITSLNVDAGKTFVTLSLAYAFARINKKVLVIDGNFQHPDVSKITKTTNFIETYLEQNALPLSIATDTVISILGNKGNDISIFEIGDQVTIKERMDNLRSRFDIILIETAALELTGKAKEWLIYADKVVALFEAGVSIHTGDKQLIAFLKGLGNQFSGFILNKVTDPAAEKGK